MKEFARRLKEASRGSDYAVRLGSDDFLLVLPKCNLGEAKLVLDRLGSLEVNCSGQKIILACTTGWADYQPGDLPVDLLKRAGQILQLYKKASKDIFSTTRTASQTTPRKARGLMSGTASKAVAQVVLASRKSAP